MPCLDVTRATEGYLQRPGLFGKAGQGGAVQRDYIQLLMSVQDDDSSWRVCQVHVGRMDQTHSEEGWGGYPLGLRVALSANAYAFSSKMQGPSERCLP